MSPTLSFLLPVLLVAGAGLSLLATGGLIRRPQRTALLGWSGLSLGGIALVWISVQPPTLQTSLFTGPAAGMIQYWIGWLVCVLVYASLYPTLADDDAAPEQAGLALTACGGLLLVAVAAESLLLGLGLELISLCVTGFLWRDQRVEEATNAALTHFRLSLLSSALFLLGLSFLYGQTGATTLDGLAAWRPPVEGDGGGMPYLGTLGLTLIVCGLGFRLGIIPLQFGLPDLLERGGFARSSLWLILGRAAAFLTLIRLLGTAFAAQAEVAQPLLIVLAAATLGIAATLAAAEQNLHRQINYLLLAEGGLILGTLAVHFWEIEYPRQSFAGMNVLPAAPALATCGLTIHLLSAAGLLACLSRFQSGSSQPLSPESLSGAFRTSPLFCLALMFFLLNLCGMPPLPGFWSRLLSLLSLLSVQRESTETFLPGPHGGFLALALLQLYLMLVATVITLRLFMNLFLEVQRTRPATPTSRLIPVLVGSLVLLMFVLGLLPGLWLLHFQDVAPIGQ